jgi:hypothetical protein
VDPEQLIGCGGDARQRPAPRNIVEREVRDGRLALRIAIEVDRRPIMPRPGGTDRIADWALPTSVSNVIDALAVGERVIWRC